jgi:hypothetical protein
MLDDALLSNVELPSDEGETIAPTHTERSRHKPVTVGTPLTLTLDACHCIPMFAPTRA